MTTTYIDALGDQLTDADKLRILADWHDVQDDKREFAGEREVQRDLRRIADALEAQQAVVVAVLACADRNHPDNIEALHGEMRGRLAIICASIPASLWNRVLDALAAVDAPKEGEG